MVTLNQCIIIRDISLFTVEWNLKKAAFQCSHIYALSSFKSQNQARIDRTQKVIQCIQPFGWVWFREGLLVLYNMCYINNYSASLYYAQTKKYVWVSAGNILEAAYVLSMMYFLFIFLHRTSSLSVCQIMCQILEVAREGKKQKEGVRSRWKEVKLERRGEWMVVAT